MSAYFGALGRFSQTLGSTLTGSVRARSVLRDRRGSTSPISQARLDPANIPVSVYSRLIEGVNRNLPSFHRYLKLRKRMMGIDELHYYDLYAPLVGSVNLEYTPEEAQKHIAAAVAPLGPDYVAAINRAFNERWIDLMPNEGKRSGAYMSGSAYDVHPYMLINYNGKYTDMSTVAHELGHAMHSFHSNRAQPFELAGYQTFVAEVASQFNEDLLLEYVLKQVKDKDVRIAILGNYLETLKATVFRQTQFADFELQVHQLAKQGKPLTGDVDGQALSRHHQEVLRSRPGRLHRRRLHRARVERHPALLPAAITSSSTRRRSPRPPHCLRVCSPPARAERTPRSDTSSSCRPAARSTRSICSRTPAST